MSGKGSRGSGGAVPDLCAQLAEFLATLAPLGYAEKTQHDKRRAIASFIQWVQDSRIAVAALDEARVAAFLARRPQTRHKDHAPAAVQQFLEHLRVGGVVPPGRGPRPSADLLLGRYQAHLRDDQGLCPRSLEIYSPFVRAFITAQQLPKRLTALDALAVNRYMVEHSRKRSVAFVKLLRAALRSFLRFCFAGGLTVADLSASMPPVRRWLHSPVPPFLTAKEVEQVLAATDCSTARGCRAFAILLLWHGSVCVREKSSRSSSTTFGGTWASCWCAARDDCTTACH